MTDRERELECALAECRQILSNMAKEDRTVTWNPFRQRWPIHHEPLRADARALLPHIDKVLFPFSRGATLTKEP